MLKNSPSQGIAVPTQASSQLTFQSKDVTSLLLGTSCPPSLIQCRKTSWVELPLLFSLRFHILAVESPDLTKANMHYQHNAFPHPQNDMTNKIYIEYKVDFKKITS